MANHGYLLGREGVKDLMQEAFMKAFDRAATFNHTEICDGPSQEKKLRAWLLRIVANLVNDRYRGQPEASFTDELDESSLVADTPEAEDAESPDSLRLDLLKSGFDRCPISSRPSFAAQCSGGDPINRTRGCHMPRCRSFANRLASLRRISDRFDCAPSRNFRSM